MCIDFTKGTGDSSFEIASVRLFAISVSFSLRLWTVEEKIQFEVIFKFFVCVVCFLKKAKYTIHNMKEICTCIYMRGGYTTYI